MIDTIDILTIHGIYIYISFTFHACPPPAWLTGVRKTHQGHLELPGTTPCRSRAAAEKTWENAGDMVVYPANLLHSY